MVVLLACGEDGNSPEDLPNFNRPIWIVCEGNFGARNSTLSAFDTSIADTTFQNVYFRINGVKLGDNAHSILVVDSTAYICVTNSDRLEVVDAKTCESIQTVPIRGPRHAVAVGDRLFVSSFDDGAVYGLDRVRMTLEDTFALRHKPEELAVYGDILFVSSAPAVYDSVVSLIDLLTKSVDTLMIGFNPVSIAVSPSFGYVYVACSGSTASQGYVAVLNPVSHAVEKRIGEFTGIRPVKILAEGSRLAFIKAPNGSVDIYGLESFAYQGTISGNFNGLGIWGDELFTLDGNDFISAGTLRRYHSDFSEHGNYPVGIAPSGMAFTP